MVRVGGGYLKFSEYVEKYGKRDGIIIDPVPLSGVGVSVAGSGGMKLSSMNK